MKRVAWMLGALVATYLVLGWTFEHETRVRGLLSPSGAPNAGVLAIGAAYLLLRIAVHFVVPFVIVFVASRALLRRIKAPSDP